MSGHKMFPGKMSGPLKVPRKALAVLEKANRLKVTKPTVVALEDGVVLRLPERIDFLVMRPEGARLLAAWLTTCAGEVEAARETTHAS